jgi:chemosensory pili system protein ChpC
MSATREQIYAVLMTVNEDTLLLPNAAVAEVLAREALQVADGPAPDWLLGYCDWNNRRVPVVRFERLNQAATGGDPRRERLVVLNSLGRHLPSGHLAIMTQGYPHLVTLNRTAIRPAPLREGDRDDLVLTRVRIANQEALIPDLEQTEVARAQLAD